MAERNTVTTVVGRYLGGGLFEPKQQVEGGTEKYSACIVLKDGEAKKVTAIIDAAIAEKWGNKKPAGLQDWGVREGDDPEFEASFEKEFINPKSSRAPKTLIKREGVFEAVTQDDDVIYPGCNVAVSISAYAYEGDRSKNIKPGATLNLRAVMFLSHGERLGDVINAENEFEGLDSEDDDDFLAA